MKKLITILLITSVIISAFSVSVNAYEFIVEDTGSGNIILYTEGNRNNPEDTSDATYSSAWEHTATCDGGKGRITYGFDTHLVNEDVVRTYHSTHNHQAVVTNSSGREESASASAGSSTETVFLTHAAKPIWKLLR